VNLLLLEPNELDADGRCALTGRRAKHLTDVLRARVGQALRAGLLGGGVGEAVVERLDEGRAVVRASFGEAPTTTGDTLLLAVPRPKVLQRMLAHAAALGFARIVLFRSWRVDRSWMQSRAMEPALQREQLLLGLEQAGRTLLPELHRFDLFKPMVEDHLHALSLPAQRYVAHPRAARATHSLDVDPAPVCAALGPDGGFTDYELEKLTAAGFVPVSMGHHALRTETALAALWGQLDLLRGRGRR
jgi:RsmE family RNA methyltransferase